MPALIPPTQPDATFALRFNKSFKYGFCVLFDGETAADLESTTFNGSPRYVVLNINPQSQSLGEPFATSVRLSQGGGKVIERRGQVLKHGVISGQTGFLPSLIKSGTINTPPVRRGSLVPSDPFLDTKLAAVSGFKAFHDLRYLFRLYGHECRTGRTDVKMYFFDFKNDDFWRIEPETFTMTRSARRPFTYEYNIPFKMIEPADAALVNNLTEKEPIADPLPVRFIQPKAASGGFFASVARMSAMVESGLTFVKHTSGRVQLAFQKAMNAVNNVVGFFNDFHDTIVSVFDTALVLLAQLDNTIDGVFNSIDLFAPDNLARELNEWCLEVDTLSAQIFDRISLQTSQQTSKVVEVDRKFSSGRMKEGSVIDLMPAGTVATPDADPFTGKSGLGLITDVKKLAATTTVKTVVILDGETLYDVARRLLGDPNRFVDLVIINDLTHPYIVPSGGSRPSNTLAHGDYIVVPDTKATSISDDAAAPVPTFVSHVDFLGLNNQVITKGLVVAWRTDQWIGYTVTCTTGTVVEARVVIGNTGDTLTVNIPWTTPLTLDTTYTLTMVTFDARRPLSPDARAFGTDLLVAFRSDGTCDLVFNSSNDIATVSGLDNWMQALQLRLRTEVGRHPFHPTFGVAKPVGRPGTPDIALFYSYFVRRSLLSDPRVQSVRNAQIDIESDQFFFSADVQPIQSVTARPIQAVLE